MTDEYLRLGNFRADVVFRGGHYGNIELPGWKEDYELVPKEEEKYYLERTLSVGQKWREPTLVPKFKELPPLLKEILLQECEEKNVKYDPNEIKLPFVVKTDDRFSHTNYKDK